MQWGEVNRQSTRDFNKGPEITLCYIIMNSTHLSKPTECTIPRVNPDMNCGLWTIMMYLCRFIHGNKCAILVSGIGNGGGNACGGHAVYGKSLYLPLNFVVNLKLF